MSLARKYATTALMVVMWAALLWALLTLLTGCLTITKDTERNLGGFTVDADCDDNTINVELEIDERNMKADAAVER